jgi:hypothetical protein
MHHATPPSQPTASNNGAAAAPRSFDLMADLMKVRADLQRDLRTPAERRLDEAATFLLNSQAAERGRLGARSATRYDKSVDEVISAYKATRSGQLDTAMNLVNQAIESLKSAG